MFFCHPRWIKKWQFFMHKSQIEFLFFNLTSLPKEASLHSNFLKDKGRSQLKLVQDLRHLIKYRKRYRVLQMTWIAIPPHCFKLHECHGEEWEHLTVLMQKLLDMERTKCTWNWKWFQFLPLKDLVVEHFFKNNPWRKKADKTEQM